MKYTFLFLLSIYCLTVTAQDAAIRVAVFPFAYAQPDYRTRAAQIHEMVVEILRQRSNIDLIDRAKDSFVLRELTNQTREESMAAPGLVAQGKLSGAQQIIIGTVTDIALSVASNTSTYGAANNQALPMYSATVNFSLQLSDVETGKVFKQRNFSSTEAKKTFFTSLTPGVGTLSTSKEDAILKGIQACRKPILEWLNEIYPGQIKIEKIEERESNGTPKTVLVSGLDQSISKGAVVTVYEVEELKSGDKTFTRTREVSKLKVTELQGEIAVCKVTSGERVIEDKLKTGAKLEFKVK
jgi:hypothetical protein